MYASNLDQPVPRCLTCTSKARIKILDLAPAVIMTPMTRPSVQCICYALPTPRLTPNGELAPLCPCEL